MINDEDYINAAKKIGCSPAAIHAVDQVESGGTGMIDGKPTILFEPHIFWKYLRIAGFSVEQLKALKEKDYGLLNPVWDKTLYVFGGKSWEKMERAMKINKDVAMMSASYGRYQICGFNFKSCNCKTVQEFIDRMYKGDTEQLLMFADYVCFEHLDDELRARDWAGFARGYNGPLYTKNNYDGKLLSAFNKNGNKSNVA